MDMKGELAEQVEHIQQKVPMLVDQMPLYIEYGMRLLSATLILIAGWVIGNWISRRIQELRRVDETLTGFLGGFAKYSVLAVAVVTILGQFGVQTASLLAVLGAAGLAVGLALQGTLSNVAAGVMLLLLRPFKVGDEITVGPITGIVKTLGLFGTELSTGDNIYIFMPNGAVWNANIWNYSRNAQRRHDINVTVGYGDDIGKAIRLIENAMAADTRIIRTEGKTPQVVINGMGDFGVALIARFWCQTADGGNLKPDIVRGIKEALEKEGIVPPLALRTLDVKKSA